MAAKTAVLSWIQPPVSYKCCGASSPDCFPSYRRVRVACPRLLLPADLLPQEDSRASWRRCSMSDLVIFQRLSRVVTQQRNREPDTRSARCVDVVRGVASSWRANRLQFRGENALRIPHARRGWGGEGSQGNQSIACSPTPAYQPQKSSASPSMGSRLRHYRSTLHHRMQLRDGVGMRFEATPRLELDASFKSFLTRIIAASPVQKHCLFLFPSESCVGVACRRDRRVRDETRAHLSTTEEPGL